MHRIFLALAVTVGGLMAAALFSGLLVPSGRGGTYRDLHFLIGLFAAMAALLAHSIAFTYFLGTGKWVKEVARVYRLPEWLDRQSTRNKRRAFPLEFAGMMLVGATAWLGGAADTRRDPTATWATWHLWSAMIALAFTLAAFAFEYGLIVAQARLLLEVKDQADKLREARLSESATATEKG